MNSRRMSSSRLPIGSFPHKYQNLPALQSHNDTYSISSSQDQTIPIQSDSTEVTLQLKQILHRLATYQVRRVFAFCLLTVFGITILDSMIDSPYPLSSLRKIFALSYIFLNYLIVEHLILSKGHTVLSWKKIENLSAVFNMAILLLLIIFIDLRLSGVILPTKIILVPLSINLFFYIWKSKAPLKLKIFSISTQLLYSLQLLLVSFKLDNNLDWCWQLAILFIWPLLLSISLYSLAAGIMFVSSLISKCVKRNQSTNKDNMTFIIGFLWLALSTSLGFLILFSLIIVSVEQSQSKHLLRSVLHAGRYISFVVSIFTVGCYPKLVKFSAILNPFSADYQEYFERSLPHLHKSHIEMYFMRLSSTYFCSLDKNFYIKNQGNLSKLKDHMRDVKMKKLRLKNLDLNYLPSRDLEASNTGLYIDRNHDKICLGEGDGPEMQPGEKIAIEPQENLCYICCSNPSDAVLLECGHGGICMECAVENLKLSRLCMECRQETGNIVRIDPLPRINGIVKAYENITFEPGETSPEE